jgi:hypothetical protein
VQGLHKAGEIRGGGGGQLLESIPLLRPHGESLPNEPVQLGELLLASRLPTQRQHPQRRVDPTERVLKLLLLGPRRRTREGWLAVVAAPGLLIVIVMNEKVERIGDLFGPDVLYRLARRRAGYLTVRQAVATGMPHSTR